MNKPNNLNLYRLNDISNQNQEEKPKIFSINMDKNEIEFRHPTTKDSSSSKRDEKFEKIEITLLYILVIGGKKIHIKSIILLYVCLFVVFCLFV